MDETFEKLLGAVEEKGRVMSDLGTFSRARALRTAFYNWRRGLEEGSELSERANRLMVNVSKAGCITFYKKGLEMQNLVEEVLQRIA